MTWNYRMVRYPSGQGFGLHEVYYDEDGKPEGMTSEPCGFTADSPGELATSLNQARDDAYMLEAFDPPEEWGEGVGEPRIQPIHRELEILKWAEDRNIFEGGTAVTQLAKLREETRELNDAVIDENTPEIIDGIGDVVVCLVIQASFRGLSMAECIEHAWQQIKDRKGRLVDGVFQKDAT